MENKFEEEISFFKKKLVNDLETHNFTGIMTVFGYSTFLKDSPICTDEEKDKFKNLSELSEKYAKMFLLDYDKEKDNKNGN